MTRTALASLAALGLVLLALAPAAPAASKAPSPAKKGAGAKIEVLRPADGKRTNLQTLVVAIRVSTAAGFRATLGGRDLTRRFARDGGMLTAKLKRGRDFHRGKNQLLVQAGRGHAHRAATLTFVARKRVRPLLRLRAARTGDSRTPLRVRLATSHPVDRVGLRLNGRRVRLAGPAGRRSWVVALGADDGLRFGRNRVVASAERTAAGHHDRESLGFRLDRSAPLVGAGPDRVTRSGRAVVLDGRSTRAAGARGLVYRWKIVAKPRRSRARVANSTARVARLLPDLPGTYRVRLTAAPAGPAALAAERDLATASVAASQPTCLQPSGAGASTAANPLEAPPCVTPFGDPTTPPLPVQSRPLAAADELEVLTLPTKSPLGWAVQTIAADGSIRVGPQVFPRQGSWARLIVLNQQTLLPQSRPTASGGWGPGEQSFSLAEAAKLATAVKATTNRQIVIVSGMGLAQSQTSKAAETALGEVVSALGAEAPPASERAAMVASGEWSAIGSRSEPGRAFTNLRGVAEQLPPGESGQPSLPGSLNGYLQKLLVDAYTFVSPEFVPIDTQAEGSSNTLSVFEVGGERVSSQPIGNGSLGLHVAAFATGAPGGLPRLAGSGTYVVDDPYSSTDMAGVKAAAAALQGWAESPTELLIVMQTFGEGAVGPNTAPWASPDWVNDALMVDEPRGLLRWKGQPYLQVKHESELEAKLDRLWNPGHPTVAGQVGNLTGSAGHDVVANLGAGNPGVEVTRLTMVASNHAQNPALNYVRGFAGPATGRLVANLVRNPEAGWSVQSGAVSPAFSPQQLWSLAYQAPTPWPHSEGRENRAAMATIAQRLFGFAATDVREEYVRHSGDYWSGVSRDLESMRYEANSAYQRSTFEQLRTQLIRETNYVGAVTKVVGDWQAVFKESSFAGFVNVEGLAGKIVTAAIHDAKKRQKPAEVSPEAIISEALYTAADLVGFPEAYEEIRLAEMIGVLAGGFGLAEAATPEGPDASEEDPALIQARADELGEALVKHFDSSSETLGHFGDVLISDWGKLKAAGTAANSWSLSEEAKKLVKQSLSVTASQQLYEGLLPVAYDQWVVSPWFTASNGQGALPPGRSYRCPQYNPAYESETIKHPFGGEPDGALSTAIYRPWNPPGSSTRPALPFTTPYTIRALKSTSNELELREIEYTENRKAITVSESGSNPAKSLVNPLFEEVDPGEPDPSFPVSLGMSKVEFFAEYGGGPSDWRRLICAQE